MLDWTAASIAFSAYVIVVAPLVRGLPRRRRLLATTGSLIGLTLAAGSYWLPRSALFHDWLVPPALLLLGYWSSGLLFAAPMPRAEAMLERFDRLMRADGLARATPRWLAELLELAYSGVYSLIPLALAIHLLGTPAPDAERFWTVILVTDFLCFACLPWIQTRPPRAFRSADPWISVVRRLNLRILGKASIHANTFPSGHAAEALASALLVVGAPWPWVVFVAICGALVSAGAVLGRYHFAADVIAGWLVALLVWAMT